jgi:P27 family predicted phage terminase small subunit
VPRYTAKVPADLDKESKDLWALTKRQLQAQGTWKESDAAVLERYVRALERARIARADLVVPSGKSTAIKLTTTGSTGQLVQHPSVKTAREAELDAQKYADSLLLTPDARRRAGLEGEEGAEGKFGGALPS